MKKFSNKGFTLIEVLVVIGIIGIIAGFVTANLLAGRVKTRDAKRKDDLHKIRAAFEAYRGTNGVYPLALPDCATFTSITDTAGTTYLSNVPCDPSGSSYWNGGKYKYSGDTTSYQLWACIESGDDQDTAITTISPPAPIAAGASCTRWYTLRNQ